MNCCDYGCGKDAKFQFKNGKWCCEDQYRKCEKEKEKNSLRYKGRKVSAEQKEQLRKSKFEYEEIQTKDICEYGCGKVAKYKLSNGKLCCSLFYSKCENIKRKNSKSNRGKIGNRKGHAPWNKGRSNIYTQSTIKSIKNTLTYSIETMNIKHKLFSQVEEMRYNPDKPIEEKEIQVHCKNHNCPNSKEKGGWFTPSKIQLNDRIKCLEYHDKDNSYFYCSDECKNSCPLYYSKGGDPFRKQNKNYTEEEHQQFRQQVLKRDDYKCQYCENEAKYVHHTRPQKLEPFYSLDPDLAISVCKECHYKYGHKDECSTGNIKSKICYKNEDK